MEIPGIQVSIPFGSSSNIQVVYAKPPSESNGGMVVLLHGCTHSALKFFSPSVQCPTCVGLAEELRIVRLVLQKGYTPVAISSVDQKSGCWSNNDLARIQHVIQQKELFLDSTTKTTLYAIGASSGGAFAAQLVTQQLVEAAVVMVMSLPSNLITKLQQFSGVRIYLAPMPNDQGTTRRAVDNAKQATDQIYLDTTRCQALPVTLSYLVQRVPGMTHEAANILIDTLQDAHHLDANTHKLVVDPTRSNWRTLVSPSNQTYWLNQFALKPGYSPLAKALHRAWAFHEYCSEVVIPALDLFEQEDYNKKM
eukprot:CAMPEP_0178902758 /NCGR_PEP_ID=MMETSP0786-20121207/4784_1 /TAXON_ID=186022 /ORGANISM="Thalassionema frauenfeldii, Strain CCMP 1798" /LENGTH=307 /DNA_ID=CAMNT_0020574063 /DNA_START=306 /DNA_END=1229 /DNA_ORIENTATION=-